jgi:2'-5' RNA ligase
MRLFIAVNLDSGIRNLIARGIESFPVDRPPWRWVRPENWHVTLKFLGDVAETDIGAISRSLEEVSGRHTVFQLAMSDFGGFPHLRRPRVLFYNIDKGAESLRQLAADVDRALLDALGIPRDEKAFRAHVTVARVKSRLAGPVIDKLELVPSLEGAVQRVDSFDLMKSELHRDGARYERLKGFALPPAP